MKEKISELHILKTDAREIAENAGIVDIYPPLLAGLCHIAAEPSPTKTNEATDNGKNENPMPGKDPEPPRVGGDLLALSAQRQRKPVHPRQQLGGHGGQRPAVHHGQQPAMRHTLRRRKLSN